jgi:hypothetical protein
MAKTPIITTISSGYNSASEINTNFTNVKSSFENTLSLDGSTPNAMNADLDMNSNDILNAGAVGVDTLSIDGVSVSPSEVIVANTYPQLENLSNLSSVDIPAAYDTIYVGGYSATHPRSFATYKRVGSEPSHEGKDQDSGSTWWELVPTCGQVSVMDFGAMGDGSTDDTTAIQNAIDYADSIGGCIVNFPQETHYVTTSTINHKLGARVRFAGTSAASTTENYIRPSSAVSTAWHCDTLKGVRIESIAIDMQDMNASSVGFDYQACWHGYIEQLVVIGINAAASKGIYIHTEDADTQGTYWNVISKMYAHGDGVQTDTIGIDIQGDPVGATRLTSLTVTQANALSCGLGFRFTDVGQGVSFGSLQSETNVTNKIQIDGNSTTTSIKIDSGELSGTGNVFGTGAAEFHNLSGITAAIDRDTVSDTSRLRVYENGIERGWTRSPTAAGDAINPSSEFIRISPDAAYTATANPQILNGVAGQMLTLTGASNTNTWTVPNGLGVRLHGDKDMVLGLNDTLTLVYDNGSADWVEISRKNDSGATYTITNSATDRTFDCDAAAGAISASPTQAEVENIRDALLELADVVATKLNDDAASVGITIA